MKKLSFFILLLAGCGSVPTPQSSENISAVGGGFPIDRSGDLPIVNYSVLYEFLSPFAPDAIAKVTFENPAGGNPFIVEIELTFEQRELQVTSPNLSCIGNNHTYATTLEILSGGEVIESLQQPIRFELAPAMYQAFNITAC